MLRGNIHYLNPRGYGFIDFEGAMEPDGVFFHGRDLRGGTDFADLSVGMLVTAERTEMTRRGVTAREVRVA